MTKLWSMQSMHLSKIVSSSFIVFVLKFSHVKGSNLDLQLWVDFFDSCCPSVVVLAICLNFEDGTD